MKHDKTLLIAVIVLIVLVVTQIVIAITKKDSNDDIRKAIQELQVNAAKTPTAIKPVDGHTPQLGVDYFIPQPIPGQNGNSIQGPTGPTGPKGDTGAKGDSAYEIAVNNGYKGTEKEWTESLKPKEKPPTDLELNCLGGLIVKRLVGDELWQGTNIKCEVAP